MNKLEITNILDRVDRQLREEANTAAVAKPAVVKLLAQYKALHTRRAVLVRDMRKMERQIRALGAEFRETYGPSDQHRVYVQAYYSGAAGLTPKQLKFKELRDALRIAKMANAPEDVKQQQAILRQIVALVPAAPGRART